MPSYTPRMVNTLADYLVGMDASVEVIDNLVDAGQHSEKIDATVWRNHEHLRIILDMDVVKDSGEDLTKYTEALAKGKAFAPNEPK